MEKTIVTRDELYEMVWSEPLIRLAEKYNISDNGLRKICKKMEIPLPDNGYWLKIKYNKPVQKKELHKNYSGDKEINLTIRQDDIMDDTSILSIRKFLLKSYKSMDNTLFQVPLKLSNPDNLTIDAQKKLLECKKSEYYRGGMIYSSNGGLNICVFPENKERALRIFDTIIKILN